MTIKTPHSRVFKAAGISAVIALFSFLVACVESAYSVANIQTGKRYVGLHNEQVPQGVEQPKLPETIKINYSKKPAKLAVYLNGQSIGDRFVLGDSAAELPVVEVKELLKQGKNVLLVDPLAFGPTVNFIFDNEGPILDVVALEDVSGALNLTLRAVDTVAVSSITIERMNYQFDGAFDSRFPNFKKESITATGQVTPLTENADGSWTTVSSVTPAKMYRLIATDAYGYTTTDYYLAPEETINNVFKLKLDKSVLDSVVPTLSGQMENMHIYAPQEIAYRNQPVPNSPNAKPAAILDTLSQWWTSSGIFYGDVGAAIKTSTEYNAGGAYTLEAGDSSHCGFANIDTSTLNLRKEDFVCTDIRRERSGVLNRKYYCRLSDLRHKNYPDDIKPGYCSRISITELSLGNADSLKFTMSESQNNRLRLETKVNDVNVKLGIRHIRCGFQEEDFRNRLSGIAPYRERGIEVNSSTGVPTGNLVYTGGSRGGFCRDVGGASYLGVGLGALNVNASSADMKGDVDASVLNGNLNLAVVSGFNLGLSNDLSIGSSLDWIIGPLSGILNGLFVGIVESTLKQNMQDFKLGFDLCLETDNCPQDVAIPNDPSMRMLSQAYQVWTEAANKKWYMYYSGFFKAIKQHPEVPLLLGSRYRTEEVLHPANSGSQIDMAINVNIINQALMSMFRSGVTHITVTNLKVDGKALVHFGPSVSDSFPAQQGDMRVELVPQTPGLFEMAQGDTGTQATLYYRNAQMLIETYRNGAWETDFDIAVDIRAGVLMNIEDGEFQMTILGTPELTLNRITAKGSNKFLPDNVLRQLVQFGVDLLMTVAVPQISDSFAGFRIPALPVGDAGHVIQVSSETLEANNGKHLGFGFGLSVEQAAP